MGAASFFVYILRCSDGSYYVGHCSDPAVRVQVHNDGKGAAWTARRRPIELVYSEPGSTELHAIRREKQIKRWSRSKREALIQGDFGRLKSLARSRAVHGSPFP